MLPVFRLSAMVMMLMMTMIVTCIIESELSAAGLRTATQDIIDGY